jgi:hypothetical protein
MDEIPAKGKESSDSAQADVMNELSKNACSKHALSSSTPFLGDMLMYQSRVY